MNELTPKYKKARANARCQEHLADSRSAVSVTMIFPDGSSAADHRKRQEQQSGDFQPEHMQHLAYAAERDTTSPVKSPYPAILAGLAARNAQKCPALSTEIAG